MHKFIQTNTLKIYCKFDYHKIRLLYQSRITEMIQKQEANKFNMLFIKHRI